LSIIIGSIGYVSGPALITCGLTYAFCLSLLSMSASSQYVQMSIDQLYVNYVLANPTLVLSVERPNMNNLNESLHPFYFTYLPSTKPALHKHS
jgi:hypothetical protein